MTDNAFPGAPNLDCETMDPDELWKWGLDAAKHPKRYGLALFGKRPQAEVSASRLGFYAQNKATAMRCRLAGDLQAAGIYETICQNIYDRLPVWARW